eukprot:8752668-Pyramimonas_sp.AAC.1
MQHAEANAAGATREAGRRLAQEENEKLRQQERKLLRERWLMLRGGTERERLENRQHERIRSSAINSKLLDVRLTE